MSEPSIEEEWRSSIDNALLKEHVDKYNVYWGPSSQFPVNCTTTCGTDGLPACTAPPLSALTIITLLVIFCIAIAVGTDITFDKVQIVWRAKKVGFLIGCLSQYGFMPAISLALAAAADLDKLSTIGVLLVGISPGGSTSNLYTMWTNGNVALSVSMSAFSTVTSFGMIPLLYFLYVRTALGVTDAALQLPIANIIISLFFSIIVPICLGMLIRRFNDSTQPKVGGACNCIYGVKCGGRFLYKWIGTVGSVLGILFLIIAVVVGIRRDPYIMDASQYSSLWIIAAFYQPIGTLFGLLVTHALSFVPFLSLNSADARAIGLETGVQSYALVIAIVQLSFDTETCVGRSVYAFVAISSIWYVISSFWIAIALCCFHTPYLPGDKEAKAEEAKQNMAKVELAKQSFGGIYKTPEECSKELSALKGAEIAGVAAV